MRTALFYDTETTGLPLFKAPSEHPDQPHLVQLAAALVDLDTRATLASMDVVIQPNGWVIPKDVSEIHGITTEYAHDVGIPEGMAVDMFMQLWGQRTRIAHNEQFDARILRIALMRYVDQRQPGISLRTSDVWKSSIACQCTAQLATPIVKCPPTAKMLAAGRNHYKTANLGEAYQFFTGRPLENAHSAMADVQGCMAVYFAIKDHEAAAAVA